MSEYMSNNFTSDDDNDDNHRDTMDKTETNTYDTSDTNTLNSNDAKLFDSLVPSLSNILKKDKEEVYKVLKDNGLVEGVNLLASKATDGSFSTPLPDAVLEENTKVKDKILKDINEQLTYEEVQKVRELLNFNDITMAKAARVFEFWRENKNIVDIAVVTAAGISPILA